jgi:hypothetical protein
MIVIYPPISLSSNKRDYAGFSSDEPWMLLTNLPDLETALKAYAKRFRIEEMFRD